MTTKSKQKLVDTVDRAITANRTIKRLTEELNADKDVLRAEGLEKAEKDEKSGKLLKVELQGSLGVATISFPKDSVKFVQGADANVLVEKLGKPVWASLFEEVTTVRMRAEFEASLDLLSAADRKAVMKFVEFVPGTPAVGLPK